MARDGMPTHNDSDKHDCIEEGTVVFVGVLGAPGYGQSWDCTSCGRSFWRGSCGSALIPFDELTSPPELSIYDVI